MMEKKPAHMVGTWLNKARSGLIMVGCVLRRVVLIVVGCDCPVWIMGYKYIRSDK